MGVSESKLQRYLQTSYILADPSTNTISRKSKSNEINHYQSTKSSQSMKPMAPAKMITPDYSEMERNNIYAETPSKIKSATIDADTSNYVCLRPQRRPPVPIRTDSIRSVGGTTVSSCSSQSTTTSNSYRQDSMNIMSRSVDATSSSSSSDLITPIKNEMKSKSTFDIETSILNHHNKSLNTITNGNFIPLESVKEDECLEINNNNGKTTQNGDEQQQLIPTHLLNKKYPSSTVTTSVMPRHNSLHQRSSSTDPTDDDLSTGYVNGFNRNHRIRSSLPFIIKPAANTSKPNSLGLSFLICGNETKKVLLPAYISCLDTLKALFVRAFPQHLTMKQMDDDNIRIYIRESDKDIFYQLEDMSDVKDRSILKIVQFSSSSNNINTNSNKVHVSFKEPEINGLTNSSIRNDMNYQRLNRFGFAPLNNGSIENKFNDSLSCSFHDFRNGNSSNGNNQPSTTLKGILSTSRSTPVTPRNDEDDSRTKMALMEKQLESLTELVKELTNPTKSKTLLDSYDKSLHQQLYELKLKTQTLRNDLFSIRRMQQSLQETVKNELARANKQIQEQFERLNQNEKNRCIENEFNLYVNNRSKIDQDLEDLELTVEELQNDVKFKQCYVTINDVESFALVLSTISRSLVDLKTSFPELREKLSELNQPTIIKFLHEEPERLDYTIKKCKRLTTMLYQLKQLAINQEHKPSRKVLYNTDEKLADRQRLLEEIQSISLNSDRRIKAIEKAEKLRERRLYYDHQLEILKQMKSNSDQINNYYDSRSLTNSLSARTSICSTDSNHCSSPSSSYVVNQTPMNPSTINESKIRSQSSIKPSSKVTFSQQLITNEKSSSNNKKSKSNPPPARIQSTPSSSIISSTSSTSSSSTNGNSRFCGIIPLLSVERRLNGRCYSFSSSSTDTDSIVSNSHKTAKLNNTKSQQTSLMRASVTDLYLNNDYNRVLAKQPRKPIEVPIFKVNENLQQHPTESILPIPEPVRFSHKQNPDISNEPLLHSSQLPLEIQSNFEMFNRNAYNDDAVVISRSVANLSNYPRHANDYSSSLRRNSSIVEYHGRKYITEFQERVERRYVQIFDTDLGRMRVFEVTDYVPTKIIKPLRNRPLYPSQRRLTPNPLPTGHPSRQGSSRLPMPTNGTETKRSTLISFRNSQKPDSGARSNETYISKPNVPDNNNDNTIESTSNQPPPKATNKTNHPLYSSQSEQSQNEVPNHGTPPPSPPRSPSPTPSPSPPPPRTKTSTRSSQRTSAPIPSSVPPSSQYSPAQYAPPSYRSAASFNQHSSSGSNYSSASSEDNSKTLSNYSHAQDIEEGSLPYNEGAKSARNSSTIPYGRISRHDSPAPIDPFAKTVNTRDHHYVKRPGINNYSQPIMNNRSFQPGVSTDYAPIRTVYKESDSYPYSYRPGSDGYNA